MDETFVNQLTPRTPLHNYEVIIQDQEEGSEGTISLIDTNRHHVEVSDT